MSTCNCNNDRFPKMKITDFSDLIDKCVPCPAPGPHPPCGGGLINIGGNINVFLSLFSDDNDFPASDIQNQE